MKNLLLEMPEQITELEIINLVPGVAAQDQARYIPLNQAACGSPISATGVGEP